MLRVLDEFFWVLRREGLTISTAQAIDAVRVCDLVGLSERQALRDGLCAVLVTRREDLPRFYACFDRFFAPERGHAGDLWTRLAARGFRDEELSALRELLTAAAQRASGDAAGFAALAGAPVDLQHMLSAAGIARALAPMASALQIGFFTHEVGRALR